MKAITYFLGIFWIINCLDSYSQIFINDCYLKNSRLGHTATLLSNDTVFLFGGINQNPFGSINTDRNLGEFLIAAKGKTSNWLQPHCDECIFYSERCAFPFDGVQRRYHNIVELDNGNLLIIGGENRLFNLPGQNTSNSIIINSKNGTYQIPMNDSRTCRRYGTATKLHNGKILIIGGFSNYSSVHPFLNEFAYSEIFDPVTSSFSRLYNQPNVSRACHTATLLDDGRVVIIGGLSHNNNELQATDVIEIFDSQTEQFTVLQEKLHYKRYDHTVSRLDDHSLIIVGGRDDNNFLEYGLNGQPVAEIEVLDPLEQSISNAGHLSEARFGHTANNLSNNEFIIIGGKNHDDYLQSAEILKYSNNSLEISRLDNTLSFPRAWHSTTKLSERKFAIIGGTSKLNPREFKGVDNLVEIFEWGTPPTAEAGKHQNVTYNENVILDGSSSFDNEDPANELEYEWQQIRPEMAYSLDIISTTSSAFAIRDLKTDPFNRNIIFLATSEGIKKSSDGGISWIDKNNGLTTLSAICIEIDLFQNNIIYVGTQAGLFKSEDSGETWIELNITPISTTVNSIAIDWNNSNNVYVGLDRYGIYKTENKGISWVDINGNLFPTPAISIDQVKIDPINSNVIYILRNLMNFSIHNGLYKSTNGGSWSKIENNLTDPAYYNSFTINPANSSVIYLNSSSELLLTQDDGLSWDVIYSRAVGSLVIDPSDNTRIFFSYENNVYTGINYGDRIKNITNNINGNIGRLYLSNIVPPIIYLTSPDGLIKLNSEDLSITIQNADQVVATFTAPTRIDHLRFRLSVKDKHNNISSDDVVISVSEEYIELGEDDDDDNLLNGWEIFGYDHNGDNVIDVDLPLMGANPFHKDVFIEVDYEEFNELHTHKILDNTDLALIKPFSKAPVTNPDNRNGIDIHLDAGPTFIMVPGDELNDPIYWGTYSKSNSIPEGITSFGENSHPQIELINTQNRNLLPERKPIFHYCLSIHSMGGGFSMAGGLSILNSCNFIITSVSWSSSPITSGSQAKTIMHEFGHNLGLLHGGDDNLNCKPHYFSIMNYKYSNGLIASSSCTDCESIDYSRYAHVALNENSLNEEIGVNCDSEEEKYLIGWKCPDGSNEAKLPPYGTIDWNCNNIIETSIIYSINQDNAYNELSGFNDWQNINFECIQYSMGSGSSPLPMTKYDSVVPDLNFDELFDQAGEDNIYIEYRGPNEVTPGSINHIEYKAFNPTNNQSIYNLSITSSNPEIVIDYDPILFLLPNQKHKIRILLKVPPSIKHGTEDVLTLSLIKKDLNHIVFTDYVNIKIASDPNILPIADVGYPIIKKKGFLFNFMKLDGSYSYDDNKSKLKYYWSGPFMLGRRNIRPLVLLPKGRSVVTLKVVDMEGNIDFDHLPILIITKKQFKLFDFISNKKYVTMN